MQSVTAAMNSNDYSTLKQSLKDFDYVLTKLSVGSSRSSAADEDCSQAHHQVDEDSVMQQYGQVLREVTTIRDAYATSACNVCERLRKDLAPLKSFSKKKGFNSDKMRDTLDMIY